MSIYSHFNLSYCNPNMAMFINILDVFPATVPDDVFAQNYIWKGSYNYKGKKQPMTLTVTNFNATSGRVNATLTNSNMELLLSGKVMEVSNGLIFLNPVPPCEFSEAYF